MSSWSISMFKGGIRMGLPPWLAIPTKVAAARPDVDYARGSGKSPWMRRVNIAEPEFSYDADDPDGFRAGMARVGPSLGASQLGTSVYQLPPGQAICPYHYEYAEEEWVLVLEGRPTLRDPEGSHQLERWDLVMFPTGPEGAHQIRNETEETARVMMYSTIRHPAATVYPDSDKIAIWTGNKDDNLITARSSGVDYYHGET
jgi:uncharacterized cupin superfamily protein